MFILPQDPAILLIKFPGIKAGVQILDESVEEGGANFSAGREAIALIGKSNVGKSALAGLG